MSQNSHCLSIYIYTLLPCYATIWYYMGSTLVLYYNTSYSTDLIVWCDTIRFDFIRFGSAVRLSNAQHVLKALKRQIQSLQTCATVSLDSCDINQWGQCWPARPASHSSVSLESDAESVSCRVQFVELPPPLVAWITNGKNGDLLRATPDKNIIFWHLIDDVGVCVRV